MFDLEVWSKENQIDKVKCVDIRTLTKKENRGYPNAILLLKALPKQYLNQFEQGKAEDTIFHETEHQMDELAEELAQKMIAEGYHAIAQSEKGLGDRGEFDFTTITSYLPHKKIATMSGIGWIGKNNLLVTKDFGCALCMCSVLTDMPLKTEESEIIMPKCGACNLCVTICPAHVLHGKTWSKEVTRDEIVDVYHCQTCLQCLVKCQYSIKYARSKENLTTYK